MSSCSASSQPLLKPHFWGWIFYDYMGSGGGLEYVGDNPLKGNELEFLSILNSVLRSAYLG